MARVVVNVVGGENPGIELAIGDELIVAAPPHAESFEVVTGDERTFKPGAMTGESQAFAVMLPGGATVHATWKQNEGGMRVVEDGAFLATVAPSAPVKIGAKVILTGVGVAGLAVVLAILFAKAPGDAP